jgi:hypothetical protein
VDSVWEQKKLEARKLLENAQTPIRRVHAVLGDTSRLFGSQILVFHFPGMIERVKGGVPDQVPQRPLAGQFPL